MKIFFRLSLLAGILIFNSCSGDGSDTNSNPNPNPDPDPNPVTITYTNTISSIISNNCISCHGNTPSNGAAISLNTYARVKSAVINNGLIDRISQAQGTSGMMPKNGTRLPQATIDKVVTWKNNNYLE